MVPPGAVLDTACTRCAPSRSSGSGLPSAARPLRRLSARPMDGRASGARDPSRPLAGGPEARRRLSRSPGREARQGVDRRSSARVAVSPARPNTIGDAAGTARRLRSQAERHGVTARTVLALRNGSPPAGRRPADLLPRQDPVPPWLLTNGIQHNHWDLTLGLALIIGIGWPESQRLVP